MVTAAIVLLAGLPKLIPFEKGGLWGYRTARGEIVIEPRYATAGKFSRQGIAPVADDRGWSYIDRAGKALIKPFLFDNGPDPFREALARFTDRGKFGFFDRRGAVIIPPKFDFARPFSGGRAAVCEGCTKVYHGEHWNMQGGKWGFIDRTGTVVIPLHFEDAEGFEHGKARVKLEGAWVTIGRNGAMIGRNAQSRPSQ
jgi:hypothetical protein